MLPRISGIHPSEESQQLNAPEGSNTYGTSTETRTSDSPPPPPSDEEQTIAILTRRLRCLFGIITWPIIPLGSLVVLALLWLLYAAFVKDYRKSCSHPLHWYATLSLLLVVYIPYHATIRNRLFSYVRERDGPQRPLNVRRFDQFIHTLALLYVYIGITLVQTCREDTNDDIDMISTCRDSCPSLFPALAIYVSFLELFTFSLILPLLFLPCIYLWFLRRATEDAHALAILQDRLREEEAILRNGNVSADDIMACLQNVQLLADESTGDRKILAVPVQNSDRSTGKEVNGSLECCICMEAFVIHEDEDVEMGNSEHNRSFDEDARDEAIVRTNRCGHLFHKQCMASWVGGRWHESAAADSERPRRARRTTCPLCRHDLRSGR